MAGGVATNTRLEELSAVPLKKFDAKKFDQILFELASKALPFSGERYTPGAGVQICYEHLHRYLFATQFLRPGDTVLDLGCGVGYGALLLAGHGVRVIAVDIDSASTALLKSIAEQNRLDNITVLTGDVAQLDQLLSGVTDKIDIVACHEVIEHLSEKLQKSLVSRVGGAKPPFTSETLFLVSTPDKELYDQHLDTPNPFHAHELSGKEFEVLLKGSFKYVQSYEQNSGAVNYLRRLDHKGEDRVGFFQLGWQDQSLLIPGLSEPSFPPGEYIYAMACNSTLPQLPSVSVLADASNQYVRERLSIAAKELRTQETKIATLERLVGQIRSELGIEKPEAVQSIADEISTLKQLVRRQAEKIRSSQEGAERIGYELSLELNKAHSKIRELDGLVNTLKPWHAMAGTLLAPTPEASAKEVYRLKSYEAAMRSPGHRLVTVVGKILRIVSPIRYIKRSYRFIEALIKA